jgi:mono/diheme cytochrome c family protein
MHKTTSITLLTTAAATLALIAAVVSSPLQPHVQAAAAPATAHAGEEIFTQRCFACHSVIEDQVRFGPSLYHELKPPHPKKTPSEVRTILREGKGKMPSFKDILTPEDTDNILAYLHTL